MNLLDELEKEDRLAGKLDRLGTYRRKRGLYLGREDVSIKAPLPSTSLLVSFRRKTGLDCQAPLNIDNNTRSMHVYTCDIILSSRCPERLMDGFSSDLA